MPALADYLAKNYLTASTASALDPSDSRPHKKRKKNKHGIEENNGTLLIADDDDGLLLSGYGGSGTGAEETQEGPLMYNTKIRSAEFRKSKKNAWQSISNEANADNAAQGEDDADKLLRQTMASNARSKADLEAENAPAIVDSSKGPRMESGARAGLQTAADTARLVAEQEAREEEEQRAEAKRRKQKGKKSDKNTAEQEEETIYRDATGRRIDLSLRRQEARRLEQEKKVAEKKARDSALGEVQLRQREERKQELDDAKFLTIGRSADDEEMNARLKEQVRWDDPMAAYMATTAATTTDKQVQGKGSKGKTQARKKEYAGAAPPNRYGIKPGWRWDGVDRGNGFEKDWFQARGRKARNENLEYQWQMDE